MDKEKKGQPKTNAIKSRVQQAFGFDDDHFLGEFDYASQHPNTSPELQPAPDEFKKIMAEMERRNMIPGIREELKEDHKIFRFRNAWKPVLVLGVIMIAVLGSGVGVIGKKSYKYTERVRNSSRNDVVLNNDEYLDRASNVEEAYQEIQDQVGIRVLKLMYIPQTLIYSKLIVAPGSAVIEFTLNEKNVHFVQTKYATEGSDAITSDRVSRTEVYNPWLDRTITIEKNKTNGNEYEYSAKIVIEDTYYYLTGIMDGITFTELVKGLGFG